MGGEPLVDASQMDAKQSPVQVEHMVACQEGMTEHMQQHEHCQPGKKKRKRMGVRGSEML